MFKITKRSPRSVRLDTRKWLEKGVEHARLKVIEAALLGADSVTRNSPVDTGFFRSQWGVAFNGEGLPNRATREPEKAAEGDDVPDALPNPIGEMTAKIAGLQLGDLVTIYNPTVYANRLENGHSNQAPQGMVRLAVAEIRAAYPTRRRRAAPRGGAK